MFLLCYTRHPQDEMIYAPKLADSMHLAYSKDGISYTPLNHNSGVLFAKATENKNGSLNAKSLKNPYIVPLKEGYGIIAQRIECDGTKDIESQGALLFFKTTNFLEYDEIGFLHLTDTNSIQDAICDYDAVENSMTIRWQDQQGDYYQNTVTNWDTLEVTKAKPTETFLISPVYTDIEGCKSRNTIQIPDSIALHLIHRLSVPYHIDTVVPEHVVVSSVDELSHVKAIARYNDGTTAQKPVDWDMEMIHWDIPDTYSVEGTLRQYQFEFPIALNRADPCLIQWNNQFYFIATDDASENKTIYLRTAKTIPELVDAQEHLILDTSFYDHIQNFFWAPEFHVIENELYLFFACSPDGFENIHCHVMKLKSGGNPICATDWEMPQRARKKDASYLFEQGITLDMTNFVLNDQVYVVWAQREFVPDDLGSWLYIATVDPNRPWCLTSDPVLLSKPEYGWANNHTFVDEGPFPLITDDRIFLTFASALIDATYCVGILTANRGDNLLCADSWRKGNYPLLTSRSVCNEYGTGHNSYIMDCDGTIYNAYHAKSGIEGPRSSGLRRVHFDVDGYPVLDLTEERDVNPALKQVTMKVSIPHPTQR